jgi:hypothetical protein
MNEHERTALYAYAFSAAAFLALVLLLVAGRMW